MVYSLSTDSTPSKIIYIRSQDASNYIDSELTTGFIIFLNDPIRCNEDEMMLISLNSAEIPYSFYNIDYRNKYLNIIESQTDGTLPFNISIIIPEANYNAYEFASTLQTLLNTNTQHNIQYTVTYDKKLNKFNYLIHKNNHKVIFSFNNDDSPYIQMGFNKNTIYTAFHDIILQSINSIQMFNNHALYIRTNLVTNNISSSTNSFTDILQKITINTNPNGIITHIPINSHDNLVDIKTFNNIEIRITDEDNKLIDTQGLHFEMSILIKFVKKVNFNKVDREYPNIPIQIINDLDDND